MANSGGKLLIHDTTSQNEQHFGIYVTYDHLESGVLSVLILHDPPDRDELMQ